VNFLTYILLPYPVRHAVKPGQILLIFQSKKKNQIFFTELLFILNLAENII